ncbi:MAG TPA: hypothetical protein VGR93_06470 [Candidatus Acidoferrales bacterium]|nr:hypothetical protein [Candidatus Acidoferrales bacterium]
MPARQSASKLEASDIEQYEHLWIPEVKIMRRAIWLAAFLAAFAMPAISFAQQPPAQSEQAAQSSSKPQTGKKTEAKGSATTQSLAEAARKASQAEKKAPKATMVFTNDNIPTTGNGISVVGKEASAPQSSTATSKKSGAANKSQEAAWRQKFADARHKIEQDQKELAIMQRELGELNVQYYPDPTKALTQSVSRDDIVKKQAAIDAKQKQLEADQQALSNLEDELRAAGGDPGWARE